MFATGMNKCPRDQECAFFHPRDVSEQLAVVCPGRRPATLSPRTVHVAGILKTAQIADVRCLLEPFGEIEDIRIHEGHGSALITFADTLSGVRAINILNLIVQIPGADQPLTVQWSHHAFGEAFAPTDDEAGVYNQRSKKSRMSLCPSWILDSCLDRRCPHAHGYQAEMCPDLYCTSIWGHITIGQSQDSSGRLCVRGQYCSYAHSHKELQEMLDSSVMYRDIDRVKIVPKLCSAELGEDRCGRGSACPFAHSTQELVAVLDGAAIYRRVEREVYLQPDRRPRTARRSILCRHWVEGRFLYTQFSFDSDLFCVLLLIYLWSVQVSEF